MANIACISKPLPH